MCDWQCIHFLVEPFSLCFLCLAPESFAPPGAGKLVKDFACFLEAFLFPGFIFRLMIYLHCYFLNCGGAINTKVTPWFFARLDPT